MKRLFIILVSAAVVLIGTAAGGQTNSKELGLPELHKIRHVTLSPSYSCRSKEEAVSGYANTALFLSANSKNRNRPELVFNGACKSPDYFGGQTAGDDFDVITDYGDVPLESLTLSQAFSPLRRTDSLAAFTHTAKVQAGHTYGMLINKDECRGFLYFRVLSYVPNQKVELEYVVMDYQVLRREAQSPGFTWDEVGVR